MTRTDLKTGKVEVLADSYQGKPFVGPNDVTIDGKGRLYFTDLAGVAVYRIDAPGTVARILAAPDIQRPNGIQVSPDDRTLYLDRGQPGAGRRAPDPRLRPAAGRHRPQHARPLQLLAGPQRRRHEHRHPGQPVRLGRHEPAARHLGNARHEDRRLRDLARRASCSSSSRLPEDFITNNAFGGPDMKTLYVTAGKTLYKVRTDIAGLPR